MLVFAAPVSLGAISLSKVISATAPPVPYTYKSFDESMTYNKLGSSGILVSSCCLGTMTWGNQNTAEEAASQLNIAWERGCNFLDTAECYPVPVSQERQGSTDLAIGKWLRTNGRARDEVVIASKVCGYNERFTWLRGEPTRVTRDQIIASVEASLQRLGVDHLDLLQIHWPDRYVPLFGSTRYDCSKERPDEVPFEEQARAMGELIRSGKIRSWGLSNETPLGVCEFIAACKAEGIPPPVSVQNSYSLLQRGDEEGLVEAMCRHDVGYLPYSPLSAGVLSGKYSGLSKPPAGSRLELFDGYFERYSSTSAPSAVEAYAELAQLHGLSPSALAIAFCESRPFVTSTIIGATSLEQLEDNLTGFGLEWTDELEAGVKAISETYPDPWRMLVRDGG
jgi:aryl-alcohol dehydrogenase-like predicted oxidoreductase